MQASASPSSRVPNRRAPAVNYFEELDGDKADDNEASRDTDTEDESDIGVFDAAVDADGNPIEESDDDTVYTLRDLVNLVGSQVSLTGVICILLCNQRFNA
jgi:hypothetical protein